MSDDEKIIKVEKVGKFTFITAITSGPEADERLDRAMDILAVWIARKYKSEHPELFRKPDTDQR